MTELKEACGVAGIFSASADIGNNLGVLIYDLLFMLQHRGQESAGIAVSDSQKINFHKDLGLVFQVFDKSKLEKLSGKVGIGHVRYSTTGSTNKIENAQPVVVEVGEKQIALAHNGNICNSADLVTKFNLSPKGSSDSEIMALLIKYFAETETAGDIVHAAKKAAREFKGAFSLILMTEKELIAIRDPFGFRPLILGYISENWHSFKGYFVASESCVCRLKDFRFICEIPPGQILVINEKGYHSQLFQSCTRRAFCIFEYIYFARPASTIMGRDVSLVRRNLGRILYREHPLKADIVIPVPDSGIYAALGYAEASGIIFDNGFERNHYSMRTFIRPEQSQRENDIFLKLVALAEVVRGKVVILIDDSIVRGNTSAKIIKMLFDAGAVAVYFLVSSPPIFFPCHFGIDTQTRKELIAHKKNGDIEAIRKFINANYLGYLSLDGMVEATSLPKTDFCTACFSGDYPISLPETDRNKNILET